MKVPIRTLIVDDEPAARRGLRMLLAGDPEIAIVGECADGREAARALDELEVDLVFLDVRMPEADGFAALEESSPERSPLVVFVTAYDEHALRAFEVHAMDYLLKPYTDERFHETLARVKQRLAERDAARLGRSVRDLALGGSARPPVEEAGVLVARSTGRVGIVPVEEVRWIEAEGDYVRIHAEGRAELHRAPMRAMEARLVPGGFVRIHRSALVRLSAISSLKIGRDGSCVAVLEDGTELSVSRAGRRRLRAALGREEL